MNLCSFLSAILLMIPSIASGQRYISGRVTDSSLGAPIPGASVFLAETMVGSLTDTEGFFRLALPGPDNFRLVVSQTGYVTFIGDIEPDWVKREINVALQKRESDKTDVNKKLKPRKTDVNLFWSKILGTKPDKNKIFVTNPSTVNFYYHPETKILQAYGSKPLSVFNLETGYLIKFVLDRFSHDYNTDTASWDAQFMFDEIDTKNFQQKNTWLRNRELAFKASSNAPSGLNRQLPIEFKQAMQINTTAIFAENRTNKEELNQTYRQAYMTSNPSENIHNCFDLQLSLFPQEKVYLHTDKPYYLAGEQIWFRAHIVDAASHLPVWTTGCVYVELFNAMGSVVYRVKTGIHNDVYSGYLLIPDDAPEGDYTIRAYTNTMRNLDEDYFFLKNIRIANPLTRKLNTTPTFDPIQHNQPINAGIRFTDALNASSLNPESIKISINNSKPMNAPSVNGISNLSFSLPSDEKQRVMLIDALYDNRPYQKYIRIPLPSDDFEVSFYPEGGQSLIGCTGRLAFKAQQQDGTDININGILYDSKGNEVSRFKTDDRGTGQFMFTPAQSEKYYAVCTNSQGQSKRFDLPEAQKAGYTLSTSWLRDNLIVKIIQPETQQSTDTLYLVIHTRGKVQDILLLDNTTQTIALLKASFPSGVSNLLLLTKDMIPLSERLVFVNNDDHAHIESSTDKDAYSTKSPVEYAISITDEWDEPQTGVLSVSVTEDESVTVDTTANILTSLLLSSDLRGYIPNPAYFFQDNPKSNYALDLLMLTQGWRRYDTERILRKDFHYPDSIYETGYEITGTVQRKQMLKTIPEANADVNILSLDGDYFGSTVTDQNGRFFLYDGGLAENNRLLIRTMTGVNSQNLILTLDKISFPERIVPVTEQEKGTLFAYAEKAEQHYVSEHGMRTILLDDIAITARQEIVRSKSSYYSFSDKTVTEEDIKKYKLSDMFSLFQLLPGVVVQSTNPVILSRGNCTLAYLVDDFPESSIDFLNIDAIERIELVNSKIWIDFGMVCGALAIYTKMGRINPSPPRTDLAHIVPVGFQNPVEFYAPKYDSTTSNKPDLRTTIHWLPNLTTDKDGKATFRFFTADTPSTYSVVIEGVTNDGKIIYKRDKISVK